MKKIGIIGYLCNTGIGSLVDDHKKFLPIDSHYVIPHSKHGVDLSKKDGRCVFANQIPLEQWLSSLRALVLVEYPPKGLELLRLCKKHHVKTICLVDIDWFNPKEAWCSLVDWFVCPNQHTFTTLSTNGFKNARLIPCSIDTDYFPFTLRRTCSSFLFNNGWGGFRQRKGFDLVQQVFNQVDYPLHVNSQLKIEDWVRPSIQVHVGNLPTRKELYAKGDIYLAPTRWEGWGLHIAEAMACGLPALVTSGLPMCEYVQTTRYHISILSVKKMNESRFSAMAYAPDPVHFLKQVKDLYGKNISLDSEQARERIEKYYSWRVNGVKFLSLFQEAGLK